MRRQAALSSAAPGAAAEADRNGRTDADRGGAERTAAAAVDRADASTMDILLLCYEYPPVGGGGGVGVEQYAEAWAAQGHRVEVVTAGTRDLPLQERRGGAHVVRVPTLGKRHRATSTGLFLFTYLLFGAMYIVRERRRLRTFDVINTHFALPTGPLGWFASRLLSLPHVLTIVGGDIFDPTKWLSPHRHALLRAFNRFLLRDADRVVAISSDTRRRAQEHYDPRRPIQVINYGFVPDPVVEAPDPPVERDGRFLLMAVGRLVPRKGFAYLIRALALLPEDVRLLLVGDGPGREALELVAREAGVDDRVTWAGYCTRPRINGYLQEADCFVLSSLHEGLGIVVQEAMYAGLPIVATNEGGQVDLLEEGRNALLVPPADTASLAEAIRRIYEEREMGRELASNNTEDIQHWFMGANCRRYLRLFRDLCDVAVPLEVGQGRGVARSDPAEV